MLVQNEMRCWAAREVFPRNRGAKRGIGLREENAQVTEGPVDARNEMHCPATLVRQGGMREVHPQRRSAERRIVTLREETPESGRPTRKIKNEVS
jgi:hypothetical protein